MNCLVIGASSYIAKAFTKRFKEQLTITALKRDKKLKNYFDLTDEQFEGFDVLINFTAIVHQKNPDFSLAHMTNTELPFFLAQKAKRAGIKQFIQMSTIAVYNPNLIHISPASPTFPATIYGKTKLEADQKLMTLQTNEFKVALIRPPIVYGYESPGNMHSLISLINRGLPLPFLYIKNQRSILYIDNLTTALYQIIVQQVEGTFILRDKLSPSLGTLCQEINQQLHQKSTLFTPPTFLIKLLTRWKQLPFYKLYGDLILDDSLTQEKIGEYSKISLAKALKKTIHKETLC